MLDTFNIQQINVTEQHDGCRVDCNFLEDDEMDKIDIERLKTDRAYWDEVAGGELVRRTTETAQGAHQ